MSDEKRVKGILDLMAEQKANAADPAYWASIGVPMPPTAVEFTPHADPTPESVPTPHADPATMRPSLGIKEAAKACRVHEDTIRRAYRRGMFSNATKGAGGAVLIPITDLLAAGYQLNAPTPGEVVKEATKAIADTASETGKALSEMKALSDRVAQLERDNTRLEAQVAELKAEKAQLLDLMGLQLKALNSGEAPERRHGWLQRRRGRA